MAVRIIRNNPELFGMLEQRANIPFARRGEEELCLQMVKPRWTSGGQGFPLVVFIQGSAWQKPNQFAQLPQLSRLAERGYVIASVTHRSCWNAPAPAFLEDVKTAVRFLRAHAEEYDIDKTRVCAFGTSSGGNTALMLGLTGDDPSFRTDEFPEESDAVLAVVDCFGPTDLNRMIDVQFAANPKNEQNLMYALGGRDPEHYNETLGRVSPVNYAKPGRDLPPFLILHGDDDPIVLYEDSARFYNQLIAGGHEADLVRVTGAPHEGNFWSPELVEIIFAFIEKHMK